MSVASGLMITLTFMVTLKFATLALLNSNHTLHSSGMVCPDNTSFLNQPYSVHLLIPTPLVVYLPA